MNGAEATQAFAATFVDELALQGLRHACISPGSRSAPLAMALARHPAIDCFVHIDERSGSFFALGLAKRAGMPVVVLCTSGTAATEMHPAVVEAAHTGAPLIVLTADRPPELRDVGANQAIDQARLYGPVVRWFADPGVPGDHARSGEQWRRLAARAWRESQGPPAGPVHLNLPFREPLVPEPGQLPQALPRPAWLDLPREGPRPPDPGQVEALAEALQRSRRTLIVAGEMVSGERLAPAVGGLIQRCGAVLMAEPTSQLRNGDVAGQVAGYDPLLDVAPEAAPAPDLLLRLGAVPTSKALNGWLRELAPPLVLIDHLGWRDPDALAGEVLRCDPALLLEEVAARLDARSADRSEWQQAWRSLSVRVDRALGEGLAASDLHEGHAVAALARIIPGGSTLIVGSSRPIRDVDAFWPTQAAPLRILANRGASGIDGLVSTGLGAAAVDPSTVLLIGDLSLYHDMNGLWAIRRHGLRAKIVVLDNDGGGIFSFLPPSRHHDVFEELFGTPLGLDLARVAELYGLGFEEVRSADGLPAAMERMLAAPDPALLAVRFSRDASLEGHRRVAAHVAAAMSG